MNYIDGFNFILNTYKGPKKFKLIFFTFFISFFKVIFDLLSFAIIGLIAAYALGHTNILDHFYFDELKKITDISKFNLLIFHFFFILFLKIFFDILKSYLVNKVGFDLWKNLLKNLFSSIIVSNYSKEDLFKTESLVLTESLNVVWNFYSNSPCIE